MAEQDRLFDTTAMEALVDKEGRRLKVKPVRYRNALDEARAFYGWTAHKLDILELYLKLYRRVAGNGTYLDVFAGTGRISVDGAERAGSVAVALASKAFKSLRLYERDAEAKALGVWIDEVLEPKDRGKCVVKAGDSNVLVPADLDAGAIPADRPCFALLDPNSTELHWDTVKRLAAYKAPARPPDQCKVEMWVLLNTHQVLMRLMPKKGDPNLDILDRWFGDRAAWWDLYERRCSPTLFALRYAELFVQLGYTHATPMLIRDPKTRKPVYFMIHASDHPAALSLMAWSSRRAGEEKHEPPQLF